METTVLNLVSAKLSQDGSLTIEMVTTDDGFPGQGITLIADFAAAATRASIRQTFRTLASQAWALTETQKIDLGPG